MDPLPFIPSGCKSRQAAFSLESLQAGMAELADAADSKSADLRVLGVQLPLPAPAQSSFAYKLRVIATFDSPLAVGTELNGINDSGEMADLCEGRRHRRTGICGHAQLTTA